MKKTGFGHPESGTSMVAVMMAMALFAVVAVMASQSFRNINVSNRRADATLSARDTESFVVQAVVAQYKAFVLGGCVDQDLVNKNVINVGTLAELQNQRVRSILFYDKDWKEVPAPTKDPAAHDLKRCASTAFTKSPLPGVDSFYACYNIKTLDAAHAKTTAASDRVKIFGNGFASNRGAFVEVYVRVRNLQTDQLYGSCTGITTNKGLGLEVLYSMHWMTATGSRVDSQNANDTSDTFYDTKTGSLSVAL